MRFLLESNKQWEFAFGGVGGIQDDEDEDDEDEDDDYNETESSNSTSREQDLQCCSEDDQEELNRKLNDVIETLDTLEKKNIIDLDHKVKLMAVCNTPDSNTGAR